MPPANKIHQLALAAEKNLEQLATELAHAGAEPAATQAVGKMAEVMRKIISSLGKSGPVGEPTPAPAPAARSSMQGATNELQSELAARRA